MCEKCYADGGMIEDEEALSSHYEENLTPELQDAMQNDPDLAKIISNPTAEGLQNSNLGVIAQPSTIQDFAKEQVKNTAEAAQDMADTDRQHMDQFIKDNPEYPAYHKSFEESFPKENSQTNFDQGGIVSQVAPDPQVPQNEEQKKKPIPGYDDGGIAGDNTVMEQDNSWKNASLADPNFDQSMKSNANMSDNGGPTPAGKELMNSVTSNPEMYEKALFSAVPGMGGVMANADTLAPEIAKLGASPAPAAATPPQNQPKTGQQAPSLTPISPSTSKTAVAQPPSSSPIDDHAMNDFFAKQQGLLDEFSPKKQLGAEMAIQKAENSPLGAIDKALGSFADGIMQGVARAGEGHSLQNIQEGWNGLQKNIADRLGQLNEQERQQVQSNIQMMEANPSSSYSKGLQSAAEHIAGLSAGSLKGLPGIQLAPILTSSGTILDAKAKLKEAYMQLQFSHQERMAGLAEQEKARQTTAAEDIAKGSSIPFVGPTHEQKQQATNKLMNIANPFDHASIVKGTKYQAPDGTWRIKQ